MSVLGHMKPWHSASHKNPRFSPGHLPNAELTPFFLKTVFVIWALFGTALHAEPPELVSLRQQYDKLTAERVETVYEAAQKTLNERYVQAVERAIEAMKAKGQLEDVLALEAEKNLIIDKKPVPEVDAETKPAIANLRKVYHEQLKTINGQRDTNHKAILTPYLERLKALEVTLTQASRVEAAKQVMIYRSGLGTDATSAVPQADKDGSVTNSLGMKLIPVKGTTVHFCIHETRRQDYAAFAAEVKGVSSTWKDFTKEGIKAGHEDDHPVVHVSWDDAVKFCEWLSKKEGRKYRLPTDKEWSYAMGCGNSEKWTKSATPESLHFKVEVYPWGKKFPPKKGEQIGNVGDKSLAAKIANTPYLTDYEDTFASTSPVMKFAPNENGLYDMCGNVMEWVEDWWNEQNVDHVLRGSSWRSNDEKGFNSTRRVKYDAGIEYWGLNGFRIVLERP